MIRKVREKGDSMDELVKAVSEEAGLEANNAETVVRTVVENLKTERTVLELIKIVSEETGLSASQTRIAIHTVINGLIKYPFPFFEPG